MTSGQDETLTLDAVVRRFQSADEQLRLAADKISGIVDHEEVTARASASLESSAASVKELVAKAEDAIATVQQSLKLASESLEAGAALLDSAVLTEIQRQVEALAHSAALLDQRTGAMETKLSTEIASLARALDEAIAVVVTRFDEADSSRAGVSSRIAGVEASIRNVVFIGIGVLVLQAGALVLLVLK